MSIQDLKRALKDIPGAEGLNVAYAPGTGNLLVTIGRRTVEVRPAASNAEIALAFSNPLITTANIAPAPAPAPLKPTGTTKMSITGAVNASMTIKDIIASSRQTVKAAHDKLIANAGRVNDAAAALNGLGDDLGSEADDLLSMIGQFKNDLSPSTPAAPAPAPAPAPATPLPAAPALTPNA